jgi:hypothetical protein
MASARLLAAIIKIDTLKPNYDKIETAGNGGAC